MSLLIVLTCVVCALFAPYLIRKIPIFVYPALFYICKFMGGQIVDFERVRYAMMFQISVIAVLSLFAFLKAGFPSVAKSKFERSFSQLAILFLVYVGLCICWGLYKGNSTPQVFVDSYKFLEIPVLYSLFRMSWRNLSEVKNGMRCLIITMVFLGIVEIFLTERGGVGLNMVMTLFPMAMLISIEQKDKKLLSTFLLIAGMLIVGLSKTRTYIIAFFLTLLLLVVLASPRARLDLIWRLGIFIILAAIVDSLSGGKLFGETIARFLELSNGLEEAGGYRSAEIEVALPFINLNYLFGMGLGFLQFLYIDGMGYVEWGGFIHNAYVELLLKTGLIGSIFGALLAVSAVIIVIRIMGSSEIESPEVKLLCKGSVISTLSWLLVYMTAPVSTFGSLFLGFVIASVVIKCAILDCEVRSDYQ